MNCKIFSTSTLIFSVAFTAAHDYNEIGRLYLKRFGVTEGLWSLYCSQVAKVFRLKILFAAEITGFRKLMKTLTKGKYETLNVLSLWVVATSSTTPSNKVEIHNRFSTHD